MLSIYEKMKIDRIPASNVTYSILIKYYSGQGRVNEALRILEEMKEQGVNPGQIVYTCCIQVCIKHKFIDRLMPLYEQMMIDKVEGDAVLYNTLVSGLVFNGLIREAIEITKKTFSMKITLNPDVYNNLL